MFHELLLSRLNGSGLSDAFSSRSHTPSCDAFEGCMRGSHGSLWPRVLVRVLSRLGGDGSEGVPGQPSPGPWESAVVGPQDRVGPGGGRGGGWGL